MCARESAPDHIQDGKPKFIAHASKRMPVVANNYSITELELCGLAMNMKSFAQLLKEIDFDAIVDNSALTHIIKGKANATTNRIKTILQVLGSY